VFTFSEAESAVIMGRRRRPRQHWTVGYRRLQERDLSSFRVDASSATTQEVDQSRFLRAGSFSFRVPDLDNIWNALSTLPRLEDIATVGQGLHYRAELPEGAITFCDEHVRGFVLGFVRSRRDLQLHQLPKLFWMNLDKALVSRSRSGAEAGTPQVLLTYGRASRGPWRLKALADKVGRAFTSSYIGVRPRSETYTIEVLWALLNSPIANAFAFSHLGTRNNIVGDIRRIPVPAKTDLTAVHASAVRYLEAAESDSEKVHLGKLLLDVDAEVLRLYSLPLKVEQVVLAMFAGWKRVGVPFSQVQYMPQVLEGKISFSDFLRFERDWPASNKERGELIDKAIAGDTTDEEHSLLGALQTYTDYHLDKIAPRPKDFLDEMEMKLRRSLLKIGYADDSL
jgi:hypothetical protein